MDVQAFKYDVKLVWTTENADETKILNSLKPRYTYLEDTRHLILSIGRSNNDKITPFRKQII